MIAIDTSAIIAILMMEPEAERFLHMMTSRRVQVGTPTLFEAHMVLEGHLPGRAKEVLRLFLAEGLVTVVPFDGVTSELAFDAFLRFGKGRSHAAKLNFGDCQSYAVSRAHDAPLLFKGDDFVHTDVSPAYRPAP